ncbi:hypothetical protein EDD18DRAFT_1111692 [Armillaria luteobubalina]|uniref:Uncharacterized protein n=1 Tax=Armillaria luteobubalina TaxID=153913 RepID=A0AA39PIE5_9AGAR|nr:hypothetical protein EDD18DRAFT_1111692 [Armillaria luteobubalina]
MIGICNFLVLTCRVLFVRGIKLPLPHYGVRPTTKESTSAVEMVAKNGVPRKATSNITKKMCLNGEALIDVIDNTLVQSLGQAVVELPDFMPAFLEDNPELLCSPSHCHPEWYYASQPEPPIKVQPEAPSLAPACHCPCQKPPTVHNRAQEHLPSQAPSSSSAGEGSGSSLGQFPLPLPPLPITQLMTPAFASNRLPSPGVSHAPSSTSDIPSSLPRESRRGSPKV